MKNLHVPVLINTPFYFLFFFFLDNHIPTVFSFTPPPYIPIDNIALVCGSSTNITAPDGREWIKDEHYSYSTQIQEHNESTHTTSQTNSVDEIPYRTARIFGSPFTYSFPVTSGPKFVRLFFKPVQNQLGVADFQVTTGSFALLNDFNPNLVARSLEQESFMREFFVNVV